MLRLFHSQRAFSTLGNAGKRKLQKRVRRQNSNTLEGIEREKIRISRDNVVCMTAHGKLEEHVVSGIAASSNLHSHLDPLRLARQRSDKLSNGFLIEIPAKLFST